MGFRDQYAPGREHRYTIGTWPDWSALKAVRQARDLRQRIHRGNNPLDDRAAPPATNTVGSILDDFMDRHVRNDTRPLPIRGRPEHGDAGVHARATLPLGPHSQPPTVPQLRREPG